MLLGESTQMSPWPPRDWHRPKGRASYRGEMGPQTQVTPCPVNHNDKLSVDLNHGPRGEGNRLERLARSVHADRRSSGGEPFAPGTVGTAAPAGTRRVWRALAEASGWRDAACREAMRGLLWRSSEPTRSRLAGEGPIQDIDATDTRPSSPRGSPWRKTKTLAMPWRCILCRNSPSRAGRMR